MSAAIPSDAVSQIFGDGDANLHKGTNSAFSIAQSCERDCGHIAAGSAEFLRVEVGGSALRAKAEEQNAAATTAVAYFWAVGRVSMQVEARYFDEKIGEDRQAAAEEAFMTCWALRMQVTENE